MSRVVKTLLLLSAVLVGVVAVAAVSLFLFFDPNDFRDRISAAVREETGRELNIQGDISLTLFPWLAVKVGPASLGNAEGFSDERFLAFEQANLSVKLMPLIFRQRVEVGTAELDGLEVNLEVASNGRSNWEDLSDSSDETVDTGDATATTLDVASIKVTDANVSYRDAQAGTSYAISNLSLETGRIAADTPVDINAEFDFESIPGELGGHLVVRGTTTMTDGAAMIAMDGLNLSGTLRGIVDEPADFNLDSRKLTVDTNAETIDAGEIDLTVLGVAMSAVVEPFSYAAAITPTMQLNVAEFSLRELMQKLEIDVPVTADPNVLSSVSFSAKATVGENDIRLTDMTLDLDDSKLTGMLTLPMDDNGAIGFDLTMDQIAADRYMAPGDEGASAADDDASDVEIPADMIRTMNVNGKFRIANATMSGIEFSNLELGVVNNAGKLRLNPLKASFYDGAYSGDVRIDASRDVPTVSVNEKVDGVNVGTLVKDMYDVENITGTINGNFVLTGAGKTLSAIRKDLDGNMNFQLLDGAWEGTDIWYEIRRARAMFKREAQPSPELPARTKFSEVMATGVVTDGIFANDDFSAVLPFLRLTGKGIVDLSTTEVDYGMQVRILERPDVQSGLSDEELADFTETVVPVKITGLLTAPNVRPDIEGIFRGRVEEAIEEKKQELKKDILTRILGDSSAPAVGTAGEAGAAPEDGAEAVEEEDPEEKLKKDLLKKIFQR